MRRPFPRKLPSLTDPPAHRERRAAKRLTPAQLAPCLLQFPDEPGPVSAWVHNLSTRGAGVRTDREYPPGATLRALLVNTPHTFALSVEVKTVRCIRLVTGDYFLGVQFTHPLRHDELVPFLV